MPGDHAASDTTHVPLGEVDQDFFSDLRKTSKSTNINFLLGAGCSMPVFRALGNLEELRVGLDGKKNTLEKDCEVIYRLVEVEIDRRFFMGSVYRNTEYMTGSKEGSEDDIQQTRAAHKDSYTEAVQTVANRESVDEPKQVTFFASNYDLGMDLALDEAGVPTNSACLGRFSCIVRQQTLGNRVFPNGIGLGYRAEVPSTDLVKVHGCVSWRHDGDQPIIDDSYQVLEGTKELLGAINRFGKRQPEIRPNTSEPNESCTTETSTKTPTGFETLKTQAKTAFGLTKRRKHGKNNLVAKFDGLDKMCNKLAAVLPNKRKLTSTVLNETYYDQLRCLPNQLELPNTNLFVMGFSLADGHVRPLVIRTAKTGLTLKVIILCYSRDTTMTVTDYLGRSPKEYLSIKLVIDPRFGQALGTETKDHQHLDIHATTGIL